MRSNNELIEKAKLAKKASYSLGTISTEDKDQALNLIAEELTKEKEFILFENEKDILQAKKDQISDALLDRLSLNEERLQAIADSIQLVTQLSDPIGEILEQWDRPNGLKLTKKRVPFGVIGMIYEARPNVTVDATVLSLKTGNAILLRGSSSAIHSNKALIKVIHQALKKSKIPKDSVHLIEDTSRETVEEMLKLNQYLDVLIPRGGASLIKMVVEKATVPVIETGEGNCHVYIDKEAQLSMAKDIVINAKTQRPSVCNAAETLLIHREWGKENLIALMDELKNKNVECRGCNKIISIVPDLKLALEEDYATEYLDYILAIKMVDSVEDAIEHIHQYGTKHSETIVTDDMRAAQLFLDKTDAAVVYHNASTRFTDGFEFGFGAEIGISTQKLHVRGPMGLPALTSFKYIVHGNGQIR